MIKGLFQLFTWIDDNLLGIHPRLKKNKNSFSALVFGGVYKSLHSVRQAQKFQIKLSANYVLSEHNIQVHVVIFIVYQLELGW